MVRKLHVPPFWAAALGVFGLFLIVAHYTKANNLAEYIRVFQIALCSAVVISYSPDAFKASFSGRPTGIQQLILGITCSWIGYIGIACWALMFRLSGLPAWMLQTDVSNMFTTLTMFGAAAHITAIGAVEGVPRKGMVKIGVSFGLAILLAIGFGFLRPDVRGITDHMRPYLEDKAILMPDETFSDAEHRLKKVEIKYVDDAFSCLLRR